MARLSRQVADTKLFDENENSIKVREIPSKVIEKKINQFKVLVILTEKGRTKMFIFNIAKTFFNKKSDL